MEGDTISSTVDCFFFSFHPFFCSVVDPLSKLGKSPSITIIVEQKKNKQTCQHNRKLLTIEPYIKMAMMTGKKEIPQKLLIGQETFFSVFLGRVPVFVFFISLIF